MPVSKPQLLHFAGLAGAVAALPLLVWNGFVSQMNASFADILHRLALDSSTASNIVLVAVDDRSLAELGPLPVARSNVARAVRVLSASGAAAVGIDLLLAESSKPDEDQSLHDALARAGNVVIGAALASDSTRPPRWVLPHPLFLEVARVAHVHADLDSDGLARSVVLAKEAEGSRYWAFGAELATSAMNAGRPIESDDAVTIGSIRIPAASLQARAMNIRFAGPEGTFERVSFVDVLKDGAGVRAKLRGRIVIVGVTAQGTGDRLPTPVTSSIDMSGAEMHANVVHTIVESAFLTPVGPAQELVLSGMAAAAAIAVVLKLRKVALGIAVLAAVALLPFLAFTAFKIGYIVPLASMLLSFLFAAVVAGAGEYAALSAELGVSRRRHQEHAFRMQAIAHEVRTPLTAIQGTSEMIAEGWLPEKKRSEMASMLNRESQRLSSIIQTFVNLETVATGAVALKRERTNIRVVLEEALERGKLYAARKAISIEAVPADMPVSADVELLSYAVYNLLTNAVKYSPKQTTVRLEATRSNGCIVIAVTDHGYGIPPDERTRIFDRFYRSRRDQAGPEEGAGIGLALVKEIAELHGGRVEVNSRPGLGSRFTIAIPAGLS